MQLYEGLPDALKWVWFGRARAHALLAELDPAASPGETGLALDALRRAAANAPSTLLSELHMDSGFRSLRDHPEFRLVLMDLAMPANPFAAER